MNKPLIFIFITLLVDVTGIGLILPVLPDLIRELSDIDLSAASVIGGWLLFTYALPQFIFSPIMGSLSDRYGRRPVLLLALLGLGVDNLIMAMAPTIAWLFVGRFFAGAFGASISTAMAYIADISTPEKRAANFGLVGAAFGLGFILGPVIGGLLGEFGTRIPFIAASLMCFANVAFGYFILPESLSKDKRRPFEVKRANPFGALMQIGKKRIVVGLAIAYLLSETAHHTYQSTWTFYTIELFEFTPGMIGLSLGIFGLLYAIVNGWLIRIAIPKIGEVNAVYLGLGFTFFSFIGFGLVTTQPVFWALLIPAALGGFLDPAMQGIMANETEDNAQGELQGAIASITSVAAVVGPVTMTQLFAMFTAGGEDAGLYLVGAPFLAAALIMAVALLPIMDALSRYNAKTRLAKPAE